MEFQKVWAINNRRKKDSEQINKLERLWIFIRIKKYIERLRYQDSSTGSWTKINDWFLWIGIEKLELIYIIYMN